MANREPRSVLLDRFRRADDVQDTGGDPEKESHEKAPGAGRKPPIEEQPAADAKHDREDERQSDTAERPERTHRVGIRVLPVDHFFCAAPGAGFGAVPEGPQPGSTEKSGTFGGGVFGGG